QAVGNVLFTKADGLRASAVDIKVQSGRRKELLDVDVHSAGYELDLVIDLLREPVVCLHVVADDLQVHRRRNAEIQNLAGDIGGLKEELRAGKLFREARAQLIDVITGGHGVIFFETDENFRIGLADYARIAVG